ncbi:MAG: lysophospholipid acyltransferase family protein [Gammaproteobacteria bacterium]|nr:lysophospholipid acyltransferase family protein [Gammaproteobacteria bacterium]
MKKHKSLFNEAIIFIRSLTFSISMVVFTVFYGMVCVASYPFPLRYRYKVVMVWTNTIVWLCKFICRINYTVEGLENIPKDRVGVVLSKHQSTWETCYLPDHFPNSAVIVKRELLWIPFFGWGMKATSPIAINRAEKSSAMEQVMRKGKKALAENRWIIVYPEGTRTTPGKPGKYHVGGARVAVAMGAPVVPVAHNAGYHWSKRKFMKRPGTIRIVIGKPIETIGKTPESVMEEAKNWIEETCQRIGK